MTRGCAWCTGLAVGMASPAASDDRWPSCGRHPGRGYVDGFGPDAMVPRNNGREPIPTRVEAVACAFCLPIADVERWSPACVNTFYRVAERRGYLIPEETAA